MVQTFKTEFLTVQNLSSLEEDRKAWDKRIWNPRSKKELKWPNLPPQADLLYDGQPGLEKCLQTSPLKYSILSSSEDRFVSQLSLQAGDSRFKHNVPNYSEPLGPGSYGWEKAKDRVCEVSSLEVTSSFAAPERRERHFPAGPDTSDGPLGEDRRVWHSRGSRISTVPRETDVSLWMYKSQNRVAREKPSAAASYDSDSRKNGSRGSVFGEVCASPRRLKASFDSATERFLHLPAHRSVDRRTVHGLGENPREDARHVQHKIWDGRSWVEPAQFMRQSGAAAAGGKRPPRQTRVSLGSLRQPVPADGLRVFADVRQSLQGTSSMRSQGHFTPGGGRGFFRDSALLRRR
uniref:Uncharacterized protein n=1 Tax=Tetraselmis sp. GSL018 TaxID=582737 RepID=A0A061SJN1_9CHLO|mmetsp:Transcript_30661/g.72978  ORF Transcript_30661/g.72978 Transcript_30661/m.72978 type:complete len:348 (-) Transcript_30661:314-1357(-)